MKLPSPLHNIPKTSKKFACFQVKCAYNVINFIFKLWTDPFIKWLADNPLSKIFQMMYSNIGHCFHETVPLKFGSSVYIVIYWFRFQIITGRQLKIPHYRYVSNRLQVCKISIFWFFWWSKYQYIYIIFNCK